MLHLGDRRAARDHRRSTTMAEGMERNASQLRSRKGRVELGLKHLGLGRETLADVVLLLANLFRRFPGAKRSELAIRCVLNRVGESMDIQRLCPNFDRRHAR